MSKISIKITNLSPPFSFGGDGRTRTCNLLIRNQYFYSVELHPQNMAGLEGLEPPTIGLETRCSDSN